MTGPALPPDTARPKLGPIAAVFMAVTVATLAIEHGGRAFQLSGYTHLALAMLFLGTAVHLCQRSPGGLAGSGLALGGLLDPPEKPSQGPFGWLIDLVRTVVQGLPSAARETRFALAIAAFTFPPFVVGFYFFHGPQHGFIWHPPEAPFDQIASQLLVVALPEEAFFRGYLQSQLRRRLGGEFRLLGARLSGPGWLTQAALFALLHFLVDLQPARLAVFFPGLLFGWLRAARGGIGAAIVYHAMCNLLSELLARGFL